jgi:hypothetical protein
MSNHLKFCSCKACKAGRHRPGNKTRIKQASRKLRHGTKAAIKAGKEPAAKTGVDYTD